jgi:hypothetical protein
VPIRKNRRPESSDKGSCPRDYNTSAVGREVQRHATDATLRLHGFVIYRRPRNGPALWSRGGQVYDQETASRIVGREAAARGIVLADPAYGKESTL